jgi:hypothetical protein
VGPFRRFCQRAVYSVENSIAPSGSSTKHAWNRRSLRAVSSSNFSGLTLKNVAGPVARARIFLSTDAPKKTIMGYIHCVQELRFGSAKIVKRPLVTLEGARSEIEHGLLQCRRRG